MRFFGSSLVFHSGHGGVSYSRKTIRIGRFIRAKVEWRGEIEEEKRVVVEKDETVRNVARSTLPFPRLNIAIQLFDPVLRLPSGGNLLLPPPPSSGIAL